MAVRKIGINCRSVTGKHGHSGQPYESALERDFLDLLAFDLNVERYETQPVKIHYRAPDGRNTYYRPDVLVMYRRDVLPARDMPPLLAEVKYREEYRNAFLELKARFRAARQYAKAQGWRFSVLTEREIRTPYLENARFLKPYRGFSFAAESEALILERIERAGVTTPTTLLESISNDITERASLLPVLWKLIANYRIGIDLTQEIQMRSSIWPLETP